MVLPCSRHMNISLMAFIGASIFWASQCFGISKHLKLALTCAPTAANAKFIEKTEDDSHAFVRVDDLTYFRTNPTLENFAKFIPEFANANNFRNIVFVDLGTGDGQLILDLDKLNFWNSTFLGVDAYLHRWQKEGPHKVLFLEADFRKPLPIADSSVDLIMSWESALSYDIRQSGGMPQYSDLNLWRTVLGHMQRMLKKGGKSIIGNNYGQTEPYLEIAKSLGLHGEDRELRSNCGEPACGYFVFKK